MNREHTNFISGEHLTFDVGKFAKTATEAASGAAAIRTATASIAEEAERIKETARSRIDEHNEDTEIEGQNAGVTQVNEETAKELESEGVEPKAVIEGDEGRDDGMYSTEEPENEDKQRDEEEDDQNEETDN